MSNSYRRQETPAPTPAPSTGSGQAATKAELPTAEQYIELTSAAITKLYLARGGEDIDQQIRVARADVDNALICREAERKRLAENPNALREKGERPFVTVSEDRLHSRELSRLHELRDTKRGLARTQIQEALNRTRPRTLDELRKTLDLASRDIDDVANMMPRKSEEELAREEFDAVILTAKKLATCGKLEPAQSRELLEAAQRRDGNGIVKVLAKLTPEMQEAFEQGLTDTLSRAS